MALARPLFTLVVLGLCAAAARASYVDFCNSFDNLCDSFLAQTQCPSHLQLRRPACPGGSLAKYSPQCACGGLDAGAETQGLINDFVVGNVSRSIVRTRTGAVDTCRSFQSLCQRFLSGIRCPKTLRHLSASCSSKTSPFSCRCGKLDVSARETQLIVDFVSLPNVPIDVVVIDH